MNYIWDINQHEIVPTYVIFIWDINGMYNHGMKQCILMGYEWYILILTVSPIYGVL